MHIQLSEDRIRDEAMSAGAKPVTLHQLNWSQAEVLSDKNKILVVDDEDSARYALRRAFEADYRVTEACSVEQARMAISRESPEVVLLDYCMPGEDGLVLLRELVQVNSPPAVIMLTAQNSERLGVEAISAGACGILSKPYDLQELRSAVKRALAARSAAN